MHTKDIRRRRQKIIKIRSSPKAKNFFELVVGVLPNNKKKVKSAIAHFSTFHIGWPKS